MEEEQKDPTSANMDDLITKTNYKAVADSFITNMLEVVAGLNHSGIDARRENNQLFNQRMQLVDQLNANSIAQQRTLNAATLQAVLGTGVMGLKELDKSAEEIAASTISAALGQKSSDNAANTTIAQLVSIMEQINSRLSSLENKVGSAA